MIRLLLSLFNRKYEPCKACEILKEQLEIANREKADAIQTLLSLVQPQKQMISTEPVLRVPLQTAGKSWAVRRAELEREDRHAAQLRAANREPAIAKLETELGIEPEKQGDSNAVGSSDAQVQTR